MKLKAAMALLVLTIHTIHGTHPWRLVKEADGVQVFLRKITGSKLEEFKGETVINKPISVLISIIKDVPGHTRWMKDVTMAKQVKKINDENVYIYLIQKAPIVKDRTALWHRQYVDNLTNGLYTVKFWDIEDPIVPKNKEYVRMTESVGKFEFIAVDKNRTKVIYQFRGNPGSLPAELVNWASKKVPLDTLTNLKRVAEQF